MIYDLSCWGVRTAEEVSRYLHQPLIYKSTSSWSQAIYYRCCTSLSPHFCFGQYFIQRMDAKEPAIGRFLATNNPILGFCTYQVPSCHAQFILYQIWGPVGISYSDFYAEYAHCVYLNINQICAYCIQIGKYPNTLCAFSQISTHPVFVNYALKPKRIWVSFCRTGKMAV